MGAPRLASPSGQYRLDALTHDHGGEKELQFHFVAAVPVMPVRHGGSCAPCAGLPAGEVPAVLEYDGGVWYAIRQGVCGVLVSDEHGAARAYLICEPASHYYRVMTRSDWMPVLIGERI